MRKREEPHMSEIDGTAEKSLRVTSASRSALFSTRKENATMATENTSPIPDLNEETRNIWNQNATFWDDRMRDGNDFQSILVNPASERLLNLRPGETVLEIACGNGVFARHIARLGVHVIATDFSAQLLERARTRTTEHADLIEYCLVDATREDQIVALGLQRFDAAVCNQAIMDMAETDPLMRGMRQVVKPGGRFVFSLCHPSFNHAGTALCAEETTVDGELVTTYSVKLRSISPLTLKKALLWFVSLFLIITLIVPCMFSLMLASVLVLSWMDWKNRPSIIRTMVRKSVVC